MSRAASTIRSMSAASPYAKAALDEAVKVEEHTSTADPTQAFLMKEMCIVVDESDRAVRPGSKLECAWARRGRWARHSLTRAGAQAT